MKQKLAWENIKMPVAGAVWLGTLVALVIAMLDVVPFYSYIFFILIAVLFFIGSDRMSFFYFILLTVATVFVFLVMAFRDGWSPLQQGAAIGYHFLFLVHLFALYSLSEYIYRFRRVNAELAERVALLEENITEEGVLPTREFKRMASVILSNMNRRDERGYYLTLSIADLPRKAKRTALMAAGSVIHMTIRKQYDIVGKIDDETLVILLQNTDQAGMQIIQQRLRTNLAERFEEPVLERMNWILEPTKGDTDLPERLVIT